jgi:hypothetical protein
MPKPKSMADCGYCNSRSGRKAFKPDYALPLVPDHGKLVHLFLLREGTRDAFAHVHPVRTKGSIFEVIVPATLPEGRYTVFCDLTFEGGSSSTAMTSVELPPAPSLAEVKKDDARGEPDPDDSWSDYARGRRSAGGRSRARLPPAGRNLDHMENAEAAPDEARRFASLRGH